MSPSLSWRPPRLSALPVPPRGADHSEVQRPLVRMRGRMAVSTARAHTNGRQSGSALRNRKAAGQVHGPEVGTIRGGEGRIPIQSKDRGLAAPSLVFWRAFVGATDSASRSRPVALEHRACGRLPGGQSQAPSETPPFALAVETSVPGGRLDEGESHAQREKEPAGCACTRSWFLQAATSDNNARVLFRR